MIRQSERENVGNYCKTCLQINYERSKNKKRLCAPSEKRNKEAFRYFRDDVIKALQPEALRKVAG